MRKLTLVASLLVASPVAAQQWEVLPGMTSAKLAGAGWQLDGTAGLSWPDGRQAVVTYWRLENAQMRLMARCRTYFNAEAQETGDTCDQVVGGG